MQYDYLVLGSGIAGLTFALNTAPHGSVAILTKKQRSESNTNYAQGGIAAAVGPDDSWELHYEDTLRAGAEL
ncbi:MAG: L-aspartate oxidase, partial [Armatimonadota bacterium]